MRKKATRKLRDEERILPESWEMEEENWAKLVLSTSPCAENDLVGDKKCSWGCALLTTWMQDSTLAGIYFKMEQNQLCYSFMLENCANSKRCSSGWRRGAVVGKFGGVVLRRSPALSYHGADGNCIKDKRRYHNRLWSFFRQLRQQLV